MPGRPGWRATPRGRRAISEIAGALAAPVGRSPLVLLLGAGADQAIGDRPGWADLVQRIGHGLGPLDGVLEESGGVPLEQVALSWPMEAAEAVRLTLGPDRFNEVLKENLPPVPAGRYPAPITRSIARLIVAGVRVIVTLNYTDDLLNALRRYLPVLQRAAGAAAPAADRRIRVIDRGELSAWPLGRLLFPADHEVHVLKLHGSLRFAQTDATSSLLLDRSSYAAALAADSPYREVLARLFEDCTVLSVGVSWTDVPLRDAAARAKLKLPVARPMHFAARRHGGSGTVDWWEERALTASYGVRPLYYQSHAEVASMIGSVVDLVDSVDRMGDGPTLPEIADWLDQLGDYESAQQSVWFAQNLAAVSQRIREAMDEPSPTTEIWLACVRIERHLRHFIWFWLDPAQRDIYRKDLWLRVARAWDRLDEAKRRSIWRPKRITKAVDWDGGPAESDWRDRALLEFGLGTYEIFAGRADNSAVAGWLGRVRRLASQATGSIAGRRVDLASLVWGGREKATPALVQAAREACWEGVEAKLALDIAEEQIRVEMAASAAGSPRSWPARRRDRLWRYCDHVRELARVSGNNRREAGAIVLSSLLAPVDHAENALIAAYRRHGDLNAGLREPTATWAVVIGLIAVFVDQADSMADSELVPLLCDWVRSKCDDVPVESSILRVIDRNYVRYWQQYHDKAANLAPAVAEGLRGERRS